jgi:diguanylate cyclase (GGDEF)-like protein/PAS domain S-box-containing protein
MILGLFLFLQRQSDTKIEQFLESKTTQHLQNYTVIYDKYKKISELILKTKVDTPEVCNIFKDAVDAAEDKKNNARQKLYDHLKNTYTLLKVYNIKQFHFHLPNNESFLRFHKPEKFGDNLTGIRQTVEFVNSTKKPVDGFEEGRHYNGFRFVYPLFYDHKYIGCVEISFSTLAFSSEMMSSHDVASKFLMLKKVTDQKLFSDAKSNYSDSQFEEYYYEKQTDLDRKKYLTSDINCEVSPKTKEIVKLKKDSQKSFTIFDETSQDILTLLKIQNPITKQNIALFVLREPGAYILEQRNNFSIIFVSIVLLLAIVLTFIYRILNEKAILNAKVKHKTRELNQLNKKQEEYINLIDQNIITSTTDIFGIITSASDAFCNISEYSKKELIGKNHNIIKHEDTVQSLFQDLWKTINSNNIWEGEIKNKKKNGGFYWVQTTINPIFDESGKKTGYMSIRQDITDKKKIEEISITDGLTNIFNRRYFDEIFPKFIRNCKREKKLLCFTILDIDNFKKYNDTYGHQMGDDVLKKVSAAIQKPLKRADDLCFRLGGEEFGILYKADGYENSIQYINSIRKNIENLQITHEKNDPLKLVTASFGMICKTSNDQHTLDEIYKFADEELYRAKTSGRNQVCSKEL